MSVLSKRADQIEILLKNRGKVDEILLRQKQLTQKFESIRTQRDKLFELNARESKKVSFHSEWFENLEILIDEVNISVQLYIERMKDDQIEKMGVAENYANPETGAIYEGHPTETADSVLKNRQFWGETSEKEPHPSKETHQSTLSVDKESSIFSSLKKVSLPVFSGDVKQFLNWENSFSSCIDKSILSAQAKLLHLRQYLAGDVVKVLQGLGHSADAYELAKQRLRRRYGGERRKIALFLEEVEQFSRLKPGNSLELEKFGNLLDILTINLKETELDAELGSGILYLKLQQKLHKSLLSSYHRWLFEKKLKGSVESLHTFILRESEYETIAEETTKGLGKQDQPNVFVATKSQIACIICEESHGVKECPVFIESNHEERSNIVQRKGLCFGCLGKGHLKKDCKREIKCDTCGKKHNTLFHREVGESNFHGKYNAQISLRTVTIKLSHGGKELLVNALLDDGSSQSFINLDIAQYFNLRQTDRQNLAVGVPNGTFSSSTVPIDISAVG